MKTNFFSPKPKRKLAPQQRYSKKSSFHQNEPSFPNPLSRGVVYGEEFQNYASDEENQTPNIHQNVLTLQHMTRFPDFSPMTNHRGFMETKTNIGSNLEEEFQLEEKDNIFSSTCLPKVDAGDDKGRQLSMHTPVKSKLVSLPNEDCFSEHSDCTSIAEWSMGNNVSNGMPSLTPLAAPAKLDRRSSLVGGMFRSLEGSLPRTQPLQRSLSSTGSAKNRGLKALDLLEACGGIQAFPVATQGTRENSEQPRSGATFDQSFLDIMLATPRDEDEDRFFPSPSRPIPGSPGGKTKAVARVDPSSPNQSEGTMLISAFAIAQNSAKKPLPKQLQHMRESALSTESSSLGSLSDEDVRSIGSQDSVCDSLPPRRAHPHLLSMDSDELLRRKPRSFKDMEDPASGPSQISRLLFSPRGSESDATDSDGMSPMPGGQNSHTQNLFDSPTSNSSVINQTFHTAMSGSPAPSLHKNLFSSFQEDNFEDTPHSPIPYHHSPFAGRGSQIVRVNGDVSPQFSPSKSSNAERRLHIRQRSCPSQKQEMPPPFASPHKPQKSSSMHSIPLPNQDVFEGAISQTSFSSFSNSSLCPPTPMREPAWAMETRTPARKNSLAKSKLLVFNGTIVEEDDQEFEFDDHFEEVAILGSGHFADVVQVLGKEDKLLYAIKKTKQKFKGKRDRDFCLQEVKSMLRLEHGKSNHIVQLHRTWQEDGHCYTQMEFCAGGNLKNFMFRLDPNEFIPEKGLWQILHDVGEGLMHIHQCGLVHMDIKPENTLISRDGLLKIGDFGSCVEIGNAEDGREGDTVYMAIELLNSPAVKHSSADIFSLGIMLYEACSRCTLPCEGKGWRDLREDRAPPLPTHYSSSLSQMILKMLASDPFVRPTAVEVICNSHVRNAGNTSERTFRPAVGVLGLDVSHLPNSSVDSGVITPPNYSEGRRELPKNFYSPEWK